LVQSVCNENFISARAQLRHGVQFRAIVVDNDPGIGNIAGEHARVKHRRLPGLQVEPRNSRRGLALDPGGFRDQQLVLSQSADRARRGLTTEHVVKCTVFLADIDEWGAFNEVYRKYFSPPYPARSAMAASGLVGKARVEMECIAGYPD